MPEARLERTRRTLPAGYQFGDTVPYRSQRFGVCDCEACRRTRERFELVRLAREMDRWFKGG